MTTATGHQARLAIAKESSYRSALTVDELVPFINESLDDIYAVIDNEVLDGTAGMKVSSRGGKTITGGIEVDCVYDVTAGAVYGIEALIFAAMGTATFSGGRSEYKIIDELATYLTVAVNKQVSAWEYVSCKFMGFTFNIATDATAKITFDVLPYQRLRTGQAGITNSIADITSLAPTAEPTKVIFNDLVFRIADDANALTAADQVAISSFDLNFSRELSVPEFATAENSGHTNSQLTLEPKETGKRIVDLSFTIPRYSAETFLDWHDDDELLQADLKFTSGSHEFNIYIPSLKLTADPIPVSDAGLLTQTVTATAFLEHADNTTIAFASTNAIVGEFGIECKSNRSGVP